MWRAAPLYELTGSYCLTTWEKQVRKGFFWGYDTGLAQRDGDCADGKIVIMKKDG